MKEQSKSELARSHMRIVSIGLRLKICAMMLMFGALLLFLLEFVFFSTDGFSIEFIRYALGTLLVLILLDFTGRLFCWMWPNDKLARLAVIGSTAFQLGAIAVVIYALIDSTSSGGEPDLLILSVWIYCLLMLATQAASAILFLGYTRRICSLLGQDDMAWQPSIVLAAYGLSGAGAVILVILLVLLLCIAFCCSSVGGMIIFSTLWFRIILSTSVLMLVFFPFRSYGLFLDRMARAIDEQRLAKL